MGGTDPILIADTRFGFIDRAIAAQRVNNPRLIANDEHGTMLREIKAELARSHSFVFSVAFITAGALALLKQDLLDFPGRGTIVTSTYLDFNDPAMFRELLKLPNVDVRVVGRDRPSFHAKGYVFKQYPATTAIVGSSNLTRRALLTNDEWNLRFSAMPDGDIVSQIAMATERQVELADPLTAEWIDAYEAIRKPSLSGSEREAGPASVIPSGRILPNHMQNEALAAINQVRGAGEARALVVSATGTGKTILAALAARAMEPERILFIAHREQILEKASQEFARVLEVPLDSMGRVAGGRLEIDRDIVFANIQSLSRDAILSRIDPARYDLVIVDEVHRVGANSYRKVTEHLKPKFLLGLTATPERTDGFNVFELFDFNVPYEIRLQEALASDMLSPFSYYGVTDYVDSAGVFVGDTSGLALLTADQRVDHLIDTLELYGHTQDVKGLIFCSRNEESYRLSELLNGRRVNGRLLRTVALSGKEPVEVRERAVDDLLDGRIDYVLSVDIFNEGIDIPAVNQVVMLRNTQSSIVFTQQLGRGLRRAAGKDHLRVIDFIGNYSNNFLIPIALFGDSSLNKDVIRRKLIESQAAGAIAGVSSISFQEVAKQQILDALAQKKLDSMQNLKQAFLELERRLGETPKLMDFARFDNVDPVLMATKTRGRSFWGFLLSTKRTERPPTVDEQRYLAFLSLELLNGKRPQELLVLKELLGSGRGVLDFSEASAMLERAGCSGDRETVLSAIRILDFEFSTQQERGTYGDEGVVEFAESRISLTASFRDLFNRSETFRMHVEDVLDTGLYLARHRYAWADGLKVGERYSRKDACRLLNWRSNMQGVMYGYKIDGATNTCPIFITYHKADDVSESTAYDDEFLDPRTLRWFTRSRLTLGSGEVRRILEDVNPPELHIFVKKDDAESGEFYYLGRAEARDPRQEEMPSTEGGSLSVVTMKLALATPVESGVYDYFMAGKGDPVADSKSLASDWVQNSTKPRG